MKFDWCISCAALAVACGCASAPSLDADNLFREATPVAQDVVADYESMVFESDGSEIYGQILRPDRSFGPNRPCVMIFHGFAGFARFDDIGQALCRAGCVVVIPHHRGAWGSHGTYSVTHCIEDAANLARYAQSDAFRQKYQTDPKALFLVGHSMGGNTVLNAAGNVTGVRGVVLLDPCDIGTMSRSMTPQVLQNFLVENGLDVLKTEGASAVCRDIADHARAYAFPAAAVRLRDTSVLWIEAKWGLDGSGAYKRAFLDSAARNSAVPFCGERSYPCNHGLMGVRLDVTRDIADFINSCLSGVKGER